MVDFNVRGGRKLRKSYNKIKKAKVSKYMCPTCSKKSVKRITIGMWECVSCGSKYAGGAYEFTTSPGNVARRIITDLKKKGMVEIEEQMLDETPEPGDDEEEEVIIEDEIEIEEESEPEDDDEKDKVE